jgi:hypothetical protein
VVTKLRANVAAMVASRIVSPSNVRVAASPMDVEKVLHPAVRQGEAHHGFRLLGDRRLGSVRAKVCARKVEESWSQSVHFC